jgi:hypothetical protein
LKPLAIFLDLAKAFDTVSHPLLISKLNAMGIRGVALNLIKSFLHNRQQFVKVNNVFSKPRIIEYGVPQGTVLGPLLFLVFINDLCNLQLQGDITTFADDTVILFTAKTWQHVHTLAESEINKVKTWLNNNLLTLNREKSVYITFSPRSNTQPLTSSIKIHNNNCNNNNSSCQCHQLEKTYDTKYLGLLVDQHMRWDAHINTVTKKLRSSLHKFYELRNVLNFKNLKSVYNAIAKSIIQYGIVAWGGAYDAHFQKIKTVQNCILKIILLETPTFSTSLLYERTGTLQARKIYAQFIANHIHKHRSNYTKFACPHSHSTRSVSDKKLHVPKTVKNITQRNSVYLGPKIYNLLPTVLRKTTHVKYFANDLKSWLTTYKIDKLEDDINHILK